MYEDLKWFAWTIVTAFILLTTVPGIIELLIEKTKKKVSKTKADFVANELTYMLKAIERGVQSAEYRKMKNNEEFVIVKYLGGCQDTVCVTADSKAAMVKDVLRKVC